MRGTVRMASNSQKPLSATHKPASHHIKHAPKTLAQRRQGTKTSSSLFLTARALLTHAPCLRQVLLRILGKCNANIQAEPTSESSTRGIFHVSHSNSTHSQTQPMLYSTHHKNTAQSRSQSEQFITQVLPLQKHRATSANVPARIEG